MFAMIIDIVVMLLLFMTIIFCWRLNNKITELKSGRRDLLELIRTLDTVILKTNNNIVDLKSLSENSAVELNSLVIKSKENIADLHFMNDTASKLADRLERNISDARYVADKLKATYQTPLELNQLVNDEDNKSSGISNFKVIKSGFSRAKEELLSALRFVK